jgi:hypothetical protein
MRQFAIMMKCLAILWIRRSERSRWRTGRRWWRYLGASSRIIDLELLSDTRPAMAGPLLQSGFVASATRAPSTSFSEHLTIESPFRSERISPYPKVPQT